MNGLVAIFDLELTLAFGSNSSSRRSQATPAKPACSAHTHPADAQSVRASLLGLSNPHGLSQRCSIASAVSVRDGSYRTAHGWRRLFSAWLRRRDVRDYTTFREVRFAHAVIFVRPLRRSDPAAPNPCRARRGEKWDEAVCADGEDADATERAAANDMAQRVRVQPVLKFCPPSVGACICAVWPSGCTHGGSRCMRAGPAQKGSRDRCDRTGRRGKVARKLV